MRRCRLGTSASPAPYSLEWQLERAHEREAALEAEVRRLSEALVAASRDAANAICQHTAGVTPFPAPAPDAEAADDAAAVPTLDDIRERRRLERQRNRQMFADLFNVPLHHVIRMDAENQIPYLHDPAWWATEGARLQMLQKDEERDGTSG